MPQSALRWRSLFDSDVVAIVLRTSSGRTVDANAAFARLVGRTRDELLQGQCDWLARVETEAPIQPLADLLKSERVVPPRAARVHRADGGSTPVLISAYRVEGTDEQVVLAADVARVARFGHRVARSEAKYRALVETTDTGYLIVDERGVVLDANEQFVRLTGRRHLDEVRGHSVLEWTAPHDLQRNVRELKECTKSGVQRQLEIDYVHPDGTFVPIEINATAITDEGERRWIALCRDISERKRADRALRDSEEILRLISENIRDVFYLTDSHGAKTIYVNPAFETIWGRPREDLLEGRDVLTSSIHPEDRRSVAERRSESTRRRAPATMQYRIEKPDGTVRWIRDRVYPIVDELDQVRYVAGIAEDVTERRASDENRQQLLEELELRFARRTEEIQRANVRLQEESAAHQRLLAALSESEAQYRLLADNSTDVITTHTLTGIYKYVSPAARALLGYEPHELIGLDAYDFFHPDDLAPIQKSHIHVLETPATQAVTYRFRRKSGDYVWAETTVRTVRDAATDEPLEIIAVTRDVSERKRLEALEDRRQWEIAHLSRLKTLGEMASGLAHELNQPLAAITNYAAVCRGAPLSREKLEPLLEKIETQAARAGEIIRRMRNMVRKREPHWSSVHLKELVQESIAVLSHELRLNGVRAHVDAHADVPLVLADRVQIEQVLINLLRNGIESMTLGAPAHTRVLSVKIEVAPAELVTVSIADTGAGLAPGFLEHLFEPFFSTKPEGLGLGLSICRSIIEAHGGRLWAVSNPEHGATFRFSLPIQRKSLHEP